MFERRLYGLDIASDLVNKIIPNIYCNGFSDSVMLATLRALLAPRTNENVYARLNTYYAGPMFSNYTPIETCLSGVLQVDNTPNDLEFIWLDCSNTISGKILNDLETSFTQEFPQFKKMEDVQVYLQKETGKKMLVFLNETDRQVKICSYSNSMREADKAYHLVCSLIPRLFPWFFKGDNKWNTEEKALLASLTLTTPDAFIEAISKYGEKYDLRALRLEKELAGFANYSRKQKLDTAIYKLGQVEESIRQNIADYRSFIRKREEHMTIIAGLKSEHNKVSDDEVINYFKVNKNIDLDYVDGGMIVFMVKCYAEFFDTACFEATINNSYSFMHSVYGDTVADFCEEKNRTKLLTAIFGEEAVLKVKTCAAYSINYPYEVDAVEGYAFPSSYLDRIPNQHIQGYSCLGDYRPLINEKIINEDLIGAIDQCICSAQSFNVAESTTFEKFLKILFGDNCPKAIELPDGASCTALEALNWLKAQDNEESKEEASIASISIDSIDDIEAQPITEDAPTFAFDL